MKIIKLTISHDEHEGLITVDEPRFIPRKGERISAFYSPPPVVKDVIYNYAECSVHVIVGRQLTNGSSPTHLRATPSTLIG